MLNWEQGGDSNGIIIPRNIMNILGTSKGCESEFVRVTGAHKKEHKKITDKGKIEITYKAEKLKKRFR